MSWRRPPNRPARLACPSGPAKTYFLPISTIGSARRAAASTSFARLASSPRASSSLRASSHSSGDTTRGVSISFSLQVACGPGTSRKDRPAAPCGYLPAARLPFPTAARHQNRQQVQDFLIRLACPSTVRLAVTRRAFGAGLWPSPRPSSPLRRGCRSAPAEPEQLRAGQCVAGVRGGGDPAERGPAQRGDLGGGCGVLVEPHAP